MSQPRLLLVEDDQALAELVEFRFKAEGYLVERTDDGDEALLLAAEEVPDVVILDWMIEGTSGIEVCRRLRRDKRTAHVPIVMLTAREAEDDRIRGLETGADDYVTKPFSPRELMARIQVLLRRPRAGSIEEADEEQRTFGDLVIDVPAHEVRVGSSVVPLTRMEYDLLDALSSRPRMVFSRQQLLDAVWDETSGVASDEHLVDIHVGNLRRKLGDDPRTARYVVTIRGVGYRMGPG